MGIPELAMISEHFNPLVRALEAKQTVRLRVDVAARFTDEADQPGTTRWPRSVAAASPMKW